MPASKFSAARSRRPTGSPSCKRKRGRVRRQLPQPEKPQRSRRRAGSNSPRAQKNGSSRLAARFVRGWEVSARLAARSCADRWASPRLACRLVAGPEGRLTRPVASTWSDQGPRQRLAARPARGSEGSERLAAHPARGSDVRASVAARSARGPEAGASARAVRLLEVSLGRPCRLPARTGKAHGPGSSARLAAAQAALGEEGQAE